jgi:hypothetical protein
MYNLEHGNVTSSSDLLSHIIGISFRARPELDEGDGEPLLDPTSAEAEYYDQAEVLRNPQVPHIDILNNIAANVIFHQSISRGRLLEATGLKKHTFALKLGYLTASALVEGVLLERSGSRHYAYRPTEALIWAASQADLHHELWTSIARLRAERISGSL